MDFEISTAVIIFFCDALFWFLNVFLINKVIDHRAFKAGFYAAALNFTSYIAVFYFVKNLEYLTPACLGAFIGAVMATEYSRRRQKIEEVNFSQLKEEMEKIKEEMEKLKK